MARAKQIESSETTQRDKEQFFARKSSQQQYISDLEHLRSWARRIQAWIDHVEGRLRNMKDLPLVLQDAERDQLLINPHVTRLYRPSREELSALVSLGVSYPIALQEIQGFLRRADDWYSRLLEGIQAGENLNNAIWELRDSILAAIKGIEKQANHHSSDYKHVTWFGKSYTFTKNQAIAVKLLWEAYEDSEKVGVHEKEIAKSIDTVNTNFRLLQLFRQRKKGKRGYHPAWIEIIEHRGDGIYQLKTSKS